MKKKYIVELTSEERSELEAMVKKGKAAAYKIKHAHVLLNADQGPEGPGWKDAEIAKTFHCHVTTVENVRRRLVEHGLEVAIERGKHKAYKPRKLDGRAEAQLVAMACSQTPAGRSLAPSEETGNSLYAQAWKLVEYGGNGTERVGKAVFGTVL